MKREGGGGWGGGWSPVPHIIPTGLCGLKSNTEEGDQESGPGFPSLIIFRTVSVGIKQQGRGRRALEVRSYVKEERDQGARPSQSLRSLWT